MDVVCDRCQAEYEFDDALVSERGTTVKCTNCGHQFKIYRASSHTEVARSWNLRRPDATVIPFDSLAVLQKWILEGRVSKMDEISRGNEPWKPLGAIAELESFFSTAELRSGTGSSSRTPLAPSGSLRPPTPVGIRGPSVPPIPSQAMPPRPGSARPPVPSVRPPPPPSSTTAHGYAPPRNEPHDPPRGHGAPMPPTPRLPLDADARPGVGPRAAASTAEGYALGAGAPSGPDVAIGPPTTRFVSDVSEHVTLEPPQLGTKRPPPPTLDDDDDAPAIAPKRSGSLGVVVGLTLGLLVAGGLAAAAWKLGYLQSGEVPVGARAPAPTTVAQLESARRMANRGTARSLEDARDELTRALALNPDDAAAHAARAHVMALWGELLRQRADDLEVRANAPGGIDPAALRAEATVLRRDAGDKLDRARADRAHAAPRLALLRGDARATAETQLGDVARITGDVAAARVHLEAARGDGSLGADGEIVTALIARDTGLTTSAIEALRSAIARAGDRARARMALARMLVAQGDAAGAQAEFEAVLQAYPDHNDAQSLLQALGRAEPPMATRALAAGDAGATAADVAIALVAPVVTFDAGNVGTTPAPAANAGAAQAQAPRSFEEVIDEADRLQDNGHNRQARERYRAALAIRPGAAEALAGLGFVDLEDRSLSSAIENFRRALSANPRFAEAWIGLGEAYSSQGQYSQALDAYQRYLSVSPSGPHARMARGQIESLQDRMRPAGASDAGS